MKKKKICFIVSEVSTARSFLKDHFVKLSSEFDIYLVANIRDDQYPISKELAIKDYRHINIVRKIDIVNDIKAVFALKRYFDKMNFYAIHSVTPKAGLITAIAGKMSNVKNRIHIFTGQVWATKTGMMKHILMTIDKIISKFDTNILVDGESQRQFLISNKIIKADNSQVLGSGSISGVNINRFNPSEDMRESVRKEVGIGDDVVVYGFLGRLNYDKGISELFAAFSKLYETNKNIFLMIVGVDEEKYIENLNRYPQLKPHDNFYFYGHTSKPENVIQAFDVFCLPSHREGFGVSVIESACLGIPAICSDVYGMYDTIIDNETGLRHEVSNVESLYVAMNTLSNDKLLRKELGINARNRILKYFSSEEISDEWLKFYKIL